MRKNRDKNNAHRKFEVAILAAFCCFLNLLTCPRVISAQTVSPITNTTIDTNTRSIPVSKDKLDHTVRYSAKDSLVYDAGVKQLFLYRQAKIEYDDIKVNADRICYQQDSTLMSAFKDRNEGDTSENPKLSQGDESSTFTALHYNFSSKRALVENAYSQYGDGFILSDQVKRNQDQTISGLRNIYTTCNDPHPHFGIAARRIKIIPNKVAVSGSANLQIEDIPTPLLLPFGMFPLQKGQRSGFKLPTYDMSEQLGFGLREFGYYFAINDHIDLLTTADFYALGTYRVGFNSNYVTRYRYNGSLNFNYSYTKIGEPYEPGSTRFRNYSVVWNHSIHQNAMPGASFSANVNFVNNRNYQLYNTYDANTYLNNNYSSAISYSKSWAGKPLNFTAALRHNHNTLSRLIQFTLPELAFTVSQIAPFQFRKEVITPRWYEKITASYQFQGLNRYDVYDSSFSLSAIRFRDFQHGFKHTVPLNATYQVLKYLNAAFNFNYNEYWYTKRTTKSFNFSENRLDTARRDGFFTARDFNTSMNLSTRIYGIKLMKRGLIRGIRHVVTPSVGFRWQPDFGSGLANYYYNTYIDSARRIGRFSYYEGGLFGVPPDGRFGGINFGIGNTLQLKVRNRKDSSGTPRKISLIDGLDINGSYNFAVDSFQWSAITVRYRTNLTEQINISGGLTYDPYATNKLTGARSPELLIHTDNRIAQFRSADLAIRASLPLKRTAGAEQKANEEQKAALNGRYGYYADFNIPWRLSVNYTLGLQKSYLAQKQKDTLVLNQNLLFDGEVNLTSNWRVGLSSGYDFRNKQLTYTSFDIYRDLHCWEMKLGLIPFGPRRSYNFALNVKSAVLQDLKLVRRKDFRDNL